MGLVWNTQSMLEYVIFILVFGILLCIFGGASTVGVVWVVLDIFNGFDNGFECPGTTIMLWFVLQVILLEFVFVFV